MPPGGWERNNMLRSKMTKNGVLVLVLVMGGMQRDVCILRCRYPYQDISVLVLVMEGMQPGRFWRYLAFYWFRDISRLISLITN